MSLTLLADRNIYHLEDWLPEGIDLITFDPAGGLPDLDDADVLLVRTVSRINAETLGALPKSLRFVGTASAGTDHVDIRFLQESNIYFASAPGCNARAVAEYIATGLILWSDHRNIDLHELSIGVIGAGHAGSALVGLLDTLKIHYLAYDPPRGERDQDFTSATLEDVLSCDILTFHVPLTTTGLYTTQHWLDAEKLEKNRYKLIINASRGGVVDEMALLKAMQERYVDDCIIDVWENEPRCSPDTIRAAFLATPHIAGYSVQAKENATKMMMQAIAEIFDLSFISYRNDEDGPSLFMPATDGASLADVLESINPIRKYDQELRSVIRFPDDERAAAFRKMRTDRPFREEYHRFKTEIDICRRYPDLRNLGIRCG